jgi:dolichol-phosphate mannosyltransferase
VILRDIAEGKAAPLQMAAPEHDRWARSRLPVLGALALVALSRLLWIGRPTLVRDEAYYWEWSRRLGLGYFDHPPLVALVIRATTALGGASEFAARVGMVALGVGTVALAYRMGALLGDRLAGWLCLLATATCPLLVMLTSFAAPDGPLLFLWAATLYALLLAVTTERGCYWYAAGLLLGLAMLAKYTAVLLVPSVLLVGLLAGRGRLRRKEPYLACGLALLVFSPNLWWNLRHGWVSMSYQLAHGACQAGRPNGGSVGATATYVLVQAGIVGPLLAVALVAGTIAALAGGLRQGGAEVPGCAETQHRAEPHSRALLLLAFCTLVVSAFFFVVHGLSYWMAPAYFSAIICAGTFLARLLRHASPRWRTVLTALCALLFFSTTVESAYAVYVAVDGASLPGAAAKIDPILGEPEFRWREVGRIVAGVLRRLELTQGDPAVIVGDNYYTAAEVAFYTPGHPRVYSGNRQYLLWGPPTAAGNTLIFVGNIAWLGTIHAPLRRGEHMALWMWVGAGASRRGLQVTVLPLPAGRAGRAKLTEVLARTHFRSWHCH